jgi:glycosyltransferase involved in cell wall biosynthesis
MTDNTYTFSVFTATYNRADTIERVYRSLEAQTFRDFEWIVVDDGSTDGTAALIERWKQEADFPIRYFWQENRGKHVAINRGVREARGALFLGIDSDDACVPSALERLHHHWESIPQDQRRHFSAVTALCHDQTGALVGTAFPYPVTDSDSLEVFYRFKATGDKWGFQRTAVLREFPFPELPGFVPEGTVWAKIARRYRTRYVNEPLLINYRDRPSLSRGWRPFRLPIGMRLLYLAVLNEQLDYLKYAPLEFCRSGMNYARFSFHLGIGVWRQQADLATATGKLLGAHTLPAGAALYARDVWRARRAGRATRAAEVARA